MKLGRNFTNLLHYNYLTDEEKKLLEKGELNSEDVGALCSVRKKADILGQIEAAKEIGFSHIELDGAVPNPFLEFTRSEIIEVKEALKKEKMTISFHLPYTFVGAAVCAIQKEDRELSVELHKKYLEFAGHLGCLSAVIHPGGIPFYHARSRYIQEYKKGLLESLMELTDFAQAREIKLHLENETAFHNFVFTPDELLEVVRTIRDKGKELYLNLDIGHWFTVIDEGFQVPEQPEKVIEKFPSEFLYELHLNDYVPDEKIFHPPLHEGLGLLKKDNLKRYFEIVQRKGVKLVVIETAVRRKEDLEHGMDIARKESLFIQEILKNSNKKAKLK
ncbi:MAG: sugar phosphate isomerase/epimerase [Spirochaetes bacterium]|nr:sugar phosphate isomerase/epimerase [Spirochaetota bacterium]